MKIRLRLVLAAFAAGILSFSLAPSASAQRPPSVVKASLLLATNAVHPGVPASIAVVAQVAPGYHINDHHPSLDYLIPTELSFDASKVFSVGQISYPKGKLEKFVFSAKGLSVYEGEIVMGAGLRVASGIAPGDYVLQGKLGYQACNDHACLPPVSVPLTLKVRVAAAGARLRPVNADVFRKLGPG
ncbi:MAG: protein-disulfide reductase DsbD domain-containing protein [Terriglobia bacterium]